MKIVLNNHPLKEEYISLGPSMLLTLAEYVEFSLYVVDQCPAFWVDHTDIETDADYIDLKGGFYCLAGKEGVYRKSTPFPIHYSFIDTDSNRAIPELVELVESMCASDNAPLEALYTVDIPDDIDWVVLRKPMNEEECVLEKTRSWK